MFPCFIPIIPCFILIFSYFHSIDGPLCIIMEYAPYGNLRDFLRTCCPNSSSSSSSSSSYLPSHMRLQKTHSSSSNCSSGHPLLDSSHHTPLSSQFSSHHTPLSSKFSAHTPLSAQPSEISTHSYIHFSSNTSSSATPPCNSPSVVSSVDSAIPSSPDEGGTHFDTLAALVGKLSPLAHGVWPLHHDYINSPRMLSIEDISNFALQIASGLSHLNSVKVIYYNPFSN